MITAPNDISNRIMYQVMAQGYSPADVKGGQFPEISIGRPICWNLTKLLTAAGASVPAAMSTMLNNWDFYLVECPCNFRAVDPFRIEHAYLEITLPDIAETHALYPVEISQKNIVTENLGIDYGLTFGVYTAGVNYTQQIQSVQLVPITRGYGQGENYCVWDYFPNVSLNSIQGIRVGYAIIRVQKNQDAAIIIDMTCRVVRNRTIRPDSKSDPVYKKSIVVSSKMCA